MGVLTAAAPAIVICTRDRARSTAFYRDVLGLELIGDHALAAVFEVCGVQLRVSHVQGFTPHGHTILGFRVADVLAAVQGLTERGVAFERVPGAAHDALGVLTLPGGTIHVAWMKDPDGNLLSVTNAP